MMELAQHQLENSVVGDNLQQQNAMEVRSSSKGNIYLFVEAVATFGMSLTHHPFFSVFRLLYRTRRWMFFKNMELLQVIFKSFKLRDTTPWSQ
jgi:hypothetical protein